MSSPVSFLHSVAMAYVSRYDDMSDVCFLFPNRRSGRFFLKALAESIGDKPMLAPETLSISDFMERLSGRDTASRIDLLFRLYNVYKKLLEQKPELSTSSGLQDFDRFMPWAEIVLSDFGEVDQFDVNPDAIFQNVHDLRSIDSNFLTEEQIEIMERYFGYTPSARMVEGFWNTLGNEVPLSKVKERFVELWRILPELYHGLTADLEEAGLAMPGSTFRIAMQRVVEHGREILPWSKVVVVGFNMLSTSEIKLFKELQKFQDEDGDPYVEFFWDATGPVLDPLAAKESTASRAILRAIKQFPSPEWAKPFLAQNMQNGIPGQITISASPSNSTQVKIARMQIEDWIAKYDKQSIASPNTAIVVPDDSLLLPLIHSLPREIENVNLTMGYSMRYTAAASFVYHLRRLNKRLRRTEDGAPAYHKDDLRPFLSHPLVQLAVRTEVVNSIMGKISRQRLRIVPIEWLEKESATLGKLIAPVDSQSTPEETLAHIAAALEICDAALERNGEQAIGINSKMERTQLSHYRQALDRLADCIDHYGIAVKPAGVFQLVDRMLSGETVNFEGEPLEGLQIMGLLETRALDFDRLIVLSLNDSVLPKKARARTYIPEALRRGYGLPSTGRGEELSAYYFYRLLSRAKEVTLIYDARAGEGMRSGGKSRFLMQLEMLLARKKIVEKMYSYGLNLPPSGMHVVEKDEEVMRKLKEFTLEEGGRNLSASALMNYCRCPLKFYYNNVCGIISTIEPTDHIDAIMSGNILHETMLNLYFPEGQRNCYLDKRIVLSAEYLEALLKDEERIHREVIRSINKRFYHLPEEKLDRPVEKSIEMVLDHLESQVHNVIRTDIKSAPLELVGGELGGKIRFKTATAPEINVRYAIDRVDISDGKLRIVDYKTGNTPVNAPTMEDVFNGNEKAKYLLQLLLYSNVFQMEVHERERELAEEISPVLIEAKESRGNGIVVPMIDKNPVTSHTDVSEEFLERLDVMLNEIFDPECKFEPKPDDQGCRNCELHFLCGMNE